jgi:serine/threonine-protein kinase
MTSPTNYEIVEKIGQGSFGMVYRGYKKTNKEPVAIKIEKNESVVAGTLNHECKILLYLADIRGIPHIKWFGKDALYSYLVLDCYEFSFQCKEAVELAPETKRKFHRDLVNVVYSIHSKGIVHNDIKPGNIMWRGARVYLIDFGGAYVFTTTAAENPTQYGNLRYMSIGLHEGQKISVLDELESLDYVMIHVSGEKVCDGIEDDINAMYQWKVARRQQNETTHTSTP